jgi:WD40 repeat protein
MSLLELPASSDGTIQLWDVEEGHAKRLIGHNEPVTDIAFHPNGQRIASVGADKTLRIWDVEGATQVHQINNVDACVAYSPDGNYLAFGWNDSVLLWDIEANTVVHTAEIGRKTRHVAFSPDGGFLLLEHESSKLYIWDIERGQQLWLPGVPWGAAAFAADGSFLCVSCEDTVFIYDVGWEEVDEIE